jgi:perosamine synthetase
MHFIPVCEPLLAGNELEYVTKCIKDNWISSAGEFLNRFESEFAKIAGAKHASAVSNGTTALHLACVALGLGVGDEVIIPDFTMIASAFSVCYTGAKPVFVDSDPDTWNMAPSAIEAKITKRTKAIMVVHIFGQPVDMDPILEIARKYDLKVIEDAAEAHGATYRGKPVGALGDIGCFSLFANKIITTGEGGVVVTNLDSLIEKIRYFKNLAFPVVGERNYIHQDIAFNYRMPNTLAAIGLAQAEKINDYIEMRVAHARQYEAELRGIRGIQLQKSLPHVASVNWMFSIALDKSIKISREDFMAELKKMQIDSRRLFFPMHKQPALLKFGCDGSGDYPVSNFLGERGLYLPSGSGLKKEEISFVCKAVGEIAARYS